MISLSGSLCTLRPWQETDKARLAHLANDYAIWVNVRDGFPFPYTEDDAAWWIENNIHHNPARSLAIECQGALAGTVGLQLKTDVHRVSAEVGYWLGRDFRGQGIATEALRLFIPYVFSHFPELMRVYAEVFHTNIASVRVLKKAGFVPEGVMKQAVVKEGQILDDLLFAIYRPR